MSRSRDYRYGEYINNIRANAVRELNDRVDEEERSTLLSGPLINKVDRIHFYIRDNAKLHHTEKYDQVHDKKSPKPVLRRGQVFYVAIRFRDRDFDVNTDKILLNFRFGPTPSVNKGTMGVVRVASTTFTRTKEDWDCRIDSGTKSRDLVLQVYIPASVPVGIWKLHVRSGLQDTSHGTEMDVYKEESDVYILFNPWCKEDNVYMDDDDKREEYIENDQGKVYVGSFRRPRGRPWAYGQFDDVVLPVACYILELSRFPHSERGNPTQVVRAVSAGVNDTDDDGILEGRWDGEYGDGVAPFKWTGSVRILEEYMKGGFRPVKYGQCWVFSAVTTTICRALGIPCRSVTNFISAHDTNSSLTIDKFFNKQNDEIEGGPDGNNYDSIWNFHVWNDVYMARPDLPPGYGGWQAIDATPQEESDHKYQCGPASLMAVQRGDVGLDFDNRFVFSEVNADVMHWKEDAESDWGYSRLKINKYHVGRMILTKKPGEDDDFDVNDRENIIYEYKNKEGTPSERLAIHNAIRGSRRAQIYYEYSNDTVDDVEFDLVEVDTLKIGQPFQIKVTIKNTSDEERTVSAALHAKSIYYTGVHYAFIKKQEGNVHLGAKQEREIQITIDYDQYWKKLQEQCMIKLYAICQVKQTKQTWTEEDDFQIEKPNLEIEVPETTERMKPLQVYFRFNNPLNEELTECELSIDGSGLLRPRKLKLPFTVPANGKFKYMFAFRPRIHGNRKLIGSFSSKELFDINGSKSFTVVKPQ